MTTLLLWTVGLPLAWLGALLLLKRRIDVPRSAFAFSGYALVGIGLLFGGIGAMLRGAIVPTDYVGWTKIQVILDQMTIVTLFGGGFVACGLFCLWGKDQWPR